MKSLLSRKVTNHRGRSAARRSMNSIRLENLEARCLLSGITSYALDPSAIPQGMTHQYVNPSDNPAELIFGVAPNYLP